MKKTQLNEIKSLDSKTIWARVTDIRKELVKLQLEREVKDIKNSLKKRRDLAQLLTILNQKKLIESLQKEVIK